VTHCVAYFWLVGEGIFRIDEAHKFHHLFDPLQVAAARILHLKINMQMRICKKKKEFFLCKKKKEFFLHMLI